MFWKKNPIGEPPLFTYTSSCRRQFARGRPQKSDPVWVDFGTVRTRLINISAGGMAVECCGLETGEIRRAELELPGEAIGVSADLEIVEADVDGICHGRFVGLNDHMAEAIHHYVLEAQKQEARLAKAGTGRTPKGASSDENPDG